MTAGDIVIVTAGKDRGKYFLVVQTTENRVLIADGRRVKVQKPKAKNPKHLTRVSGGICPEPCTNRNVKVFLKPYMAKYLREDCEKCPKRI